MCREINLRILTHNTGTCGNIHVSDKRLQIGDNMKHRFFANTMAEANAIVDYLADNYDNYSGYVSEHNLLVSWRDTELTNDDWQAIYDTLG